MMYDLSLFVDDTKFTNFVDFYFFIQIFNLLIFLSVYFIIST